jgi:hypothetical protein
MTEVSRHVFDMIDGDHGLSRRRSRTCHAGIAIAVEKTRRLSFVSLSQLNFERN